MTFRPTIENELPTWAVRNLQVKLVRVAVCPANVNNYPVGTLDHSGSHLPDYVADTAKMASVAIAIDRLAEHQGVAMGALQ